MAASTWTTQMLVLTWLPGLLAHAPVQWQHPQFLTNHASVYSGNDDLNQNPYAWKPALTADVEVAVLRGVDFLLLNSTMERIMNGTQQVNYWGDFYFSDLLLTLARLTTSSSLDSATTRALQSLCSELVQKWIASNPVVPKTASPAQLKEIAYVLYAAEYLHLTYGSALKEQLREAFSHLTPKQLLGFDPEEGLPQMVEGAPQQSRLYLISEALKLSYFCERLGVPFGVGATKVAEAMASVKPYMGPQDMYNYVPQTLMVLNLLAVLSDFQYKKLDYNLIPDEYKYVTNGAVLAVEHLKAPDIIGDVLGNLKAFGVTFDDLLLQKGVTSLMSKQLQDGSWQLLGQPSDIATAFCTAHAMAGLASPEFAARHREAASSPEWQQVLRGMQSPPPATGNGPWKHHPVGPSYPHWAQGQPRPPVHDNNLIRAQPMPPPPPPPQPPSSRQGGGPGPVSFIQAIEHGFASGAFQNIHPGSGPQAAQPTQRAGEASHGDWGVPQPAQAQFEQSGLSPQRTMQMPHAGGAPNAAQDHVPFFGLGPPRYPTAPMPMMPNSNTGPQMPSQQGHSHGPPMPPMGNGYAPMPSFQNAQQNLMPNVQMPAAFAQMSTGSGQQPAPGAALNTIQPAPM